MRSDTSMDGGLHLVMHGGSRSPLVCTMLMCTLRSRRRLFVLGDGWAVKWARLYFKALEGGGVVRVLKTP